MEIDQTIPVELEDEQVLKMKEIFKQYDFEVYNEGQFIFLNTDGKETTYNVEDKIMEGNFNPLSEDLRDYLRRRGIKIYTGRLFESI